MGIEFQFETMEKALKMHHGDGCTMGMPQSSVHLANG